MHSQTIKENQQIPHRRQFLSSINKNFPNAAALRELLQQKPHLQQQFWELFQYDFALQDAMNHLSKN